MANFIKKRDPSSEIEKLELETTFFQRLGAGFSSILGLLNLRLSALENCKCPCNIAYWDTPTTKNYAAFIWSPIDYQSEVLRGKMCTSDATNGWMFRASKEGVYLFNAYYRVTTSTNMTNELIMGIQCNQSNVCVEIDHESRTDIKEAHIHGHILINMQRGDTVQIMLKPDGVVTIQNIIEVYGYVNVSYQCDYQPDINPRQALITP